MARRSTTRTTTRRRRRGPDKRKKPNNSANKENIFYENLGSYGRDDYSKTYWRNTKRDAMAHFKEVSFNVRRGDIVGASVLRQMANRELAKETRLLSEMFQVPLKNGQLPMGDVLKLMNKFFNYSKSLDRVLDIAERNDTTLGLNQTSAGLYREYATQAFLDNLKEIEENDDFINLITNGDRQGLEDLLNELAEESVLEGMENMLERPSGTGKTPEEKIWQELLEVFKDMQDLREEFKADFFSRLGFSKLAKEIMKTAGELIDPKETAANLLAAARKSKKIARVDKTSSDGGVSGFAAEYLAQVSVNFAISSHNVGRSDNSKVIVQSSRTRDRANTTDVTYILNMGVGYENPFANDPRQSSSNRGKSDVLDAARDFNNSIQDKLSETYIVHENTKQYLLNSEKRAFGGFKGGTRKLSSVFPSLVRANLTDTASVEKFLQKINQTIKGAIYSSRIDEVQNELAAAISLFLFDDIEDIGKSENNVIHIFRLSDVVVPLSFFLFQVADAMAMAEKNRAMKVTLKHGKGSKLLYPEKFYSSGEAAETASESVERWTNQRLAGKNIRKNTEVSIVFLQNFKKIMKEIQAFENT